MHEVSAAARAGGLSTIGEEHDDAAFGLGLSPSWRADGLIIGEEHDPESEPKGAAFGLGLGPSWRADGRIVGEEHGLIIGEEHDPE